MRGQSQTCTDIATKTFGLNRVEIIGRLGLDVTINHLASGGRVANLSIATDESYITRSPSPLDIDHMVPLCEAYESGAHAWDKARRKKFGNSLTADHHLIATWRSTNRSKNKQVPADWLPPNKAYWCTYLNDWIAIKREWGLSMNRAEADTIRKGLLVCGEYEKRDHIAGRHQ